MIDLSAAEIAHITGGSLTGPIDPAAIAQAATTDSREVRPGTLFIAKPGEHTDGHLFIDQALEAGAVFVLASKATQDPQGQAHPSVIVPDVVTAMGQIAAEIIRRIRAHSPTTVIAVTGSAGKTTTKDLLHTICSAAGPTIAPTGSYNSEVGLPLTVFQASLQTRYLVLEMGASGPGHVRYLAELAQPDISVVLTIGHAHAEHFGSQEQIAQAKAEILCTLTEANTAVLNFDDPLIRPMAETTKAEVIAVSTQTPPQHRPALVREQTSVDDQLRLSTTVRYLGAQDTDTAATATGEVAEIHTELLGAHHGINVACAVAAARAAGIPVAQSAAALAGVGPASRWRMQRSERADGVVIINDAYNANPESMRAALKALAQISSATGRRSWAVLGEMKELGENSIRAHADLGETVVRLNIDQLLVVGEGAKATYNAAILEGSWGSEAHYCADIESAERHLAEELQAGDVVLLKASNSVGLGPMGDRLANSCPDTPEGA